MEITSPKFGERINLRTEKQREFFAADRSGYNVEDFYYLDLKNLQKDDDSKSSLTPFIWEPKVQGRLEISESDSFTEPFVFYGNGVALVDNLKIGTHYYARVIGDTQTSPTVEFDTERTFPRMMSVEGISNVRDLGGAITRDGKIVKQGLIYRGSEMNSHRTITENGLETMRRVLKIKSEIDFRNSNEIVLDVYRGNYVNIPFPSYSALFKNPDPAVKVMEFLANEDNYPIYTHCWGGADRTETFFLLFELLLGYEISDTVDNYEATSLSTFGARSVNKEIYQNYLKSLGNFSGADLYEKAECYLLSIGIKEETLKKIKDIFLGD